jgi:cytochrome c oxidase subunit 3
MAAGATASPRRHRRALHHDGPFWLPTINTALLLSSGVTLTIAHHALVAGNRASTHRLHVDDGGAGRWCSWACRATSTAMPTTSCNLKLSSGVFGSTFFMLTGFHGFHVFVGMLMLLFITLSPA